MKKSLIALAALSVVAAAMDPKRAYTRDVAYGYRMPAGFPGSINRTHPASIFPVMLDQTAGQTPVSYGVALLPNTANNTYRQMIAADQSNATDVVIGGVLARPWPVQGGSAAAAFGQQGLSDVTAPVTTVPNDILKAGRAMVQVATGGTGLTINSDVYVWCAASGGGHTLGGFESAYSAGNTAKIANAKYRGPSDANGVAEIEVWAGAA